MKVQSVRSGFQEDRIQKTLGIVFKEPSPRLAPLPSDQSSLFHGRNSSFFISPITPTVRNELTTRRENGSINQKHQKEIPQCH